MVIGHRRVGVAVKLRKLPNIVPYFLIVGMEDVRTVFMDIDALHFLRIDIACHLRTAVDDHYALTGFPGLMCEHRTEQSGTDDEIIYMFHIISPIS